MGRLIKYNNNSISAITATGLATGSMVLIKEQTASASASISFVNGSNGVVLDGTYNSYLFKFINCHPSAGSYFSFNISTDGGSNYNVTKTSTFFYGLHLENDATAQVDYDTSRDLAQGTGIQNISAYVGTDNNSSVSGTLHLFSPSSTTYVKHFIARTQGRTSSVGSIDNYTAGYGNTISAINAIEFKFSSGNIDDGTIKLYGIRES